MITCKIGSLDWMDAPYNPNLSENLSKLVLPGDNQGLALTLYLIDSISGRLESIRLFGLSERFTKSLFGDVLEEKMNDFNLDLYSRNITEIYNRYKTSEIVKLSRDYCKFH